MDDGDASMPSTQQETQGDVLTEGEGAATTVLIKDAGVTTSAHSEGDEGALLILSLFLPFLCMFVAFPRVAVNGCPSLAFFSYENVASKWQSLRAPLGEATFFCQNVVSQRAVVNDNPLKGNIFCQNVTS